MTGMHGAAIEGRDQFGEDKRGQYSFWEEELRASQKSRRNWHKLADKIYRRFLDSRRDTELQRETAQIPFRLNLFHSNVTMLTSMLYGTVPTVDVSRRYADAKDDVGRVAAEMMERLLNNDIADNGAEYNAVLRSTLQDRLIPGLGCARCRYEVETEMISEQVSMTDELGNTIEVTQESERVIREDVPIDYFYWRDILWGWGRNWTEIQWIGFRSYLTKKEVTDRWGKKVSNKLTFKKQLVTDDQDVTEDPDKSSPWQKAAIWEIWDKAKRKVIYVHQGYDRVLETKDDPLGLEDFYTCPPFFMANPTTTLYAPTPDFHLAQDLYNEVDSLQTRISIITEAVKVVGVYDAGSADIQRMFKEGVDNTLIPVENWALFGEKGGLQGSIDWFPLMDVVGALDKLRQVRDETIELLYQVTGMSDVMRGGGKQYEGVGQAALKAKFGSVRVQALQDEFATFASNLLEIKAEIISKHFDPQTIARKSNIAATADAQLAMPAIELIKNYHEARLKVVIRPESVAMVDYAQLKGERTDYLNALSTFMQSAAPLIEQDKKMKPFLFELLAWGLSGFKGASEIEGVIDRAIAEGQKESEQEEKPDPAQQAMQMQMQMQQQMEQMKQQGELAKIQAKAAADQQIREQDMQADVQTAMASHQAKLAEINADMQSELAQTEAKMTADIMVEQVQTQANIAQTQAGAESEIQKDAAGAQIEIAKEQEKSALKINEIATTAAGKIREAEVKPNLEGE